MWGFPKVHWSAWQELKEKLVRIHQVGHRSPLPEKTLGGNFYKHIPTPNTTVIIENRSSTFCGFQFGISKQILWATFQTPWKDAARSRPRFCLVASHISHILRLQIFPLYHPSLHSPLWEDTLSWPAGLPHAIRGSYWSRYEPRYSQCLHHHHYHHHHHHHHRDHRHHHRHHHHHHHHHLLLLRICVLCIHVDTR